MTRTFGVEEEVLLVSRVSGRPLPLALHVLGSATDLVGPTETAPPAERPDSVGDAPVLALEMHQEMLEIISPPRATGGQLIAEVRRGRAIADRGAAAHGARIAALASSPIPVVPHPNPSERYGRMMARYGTTARNCLSCGLHVHVAVVDDEEGVAVLDRIRSWLPVLTALSANSPYAAGEDTGYASFRSVAWGSWPVSGPTPVFGSCAAYRRHEERILETGILLDERMLYFDARLSRTHPTVEIRVADVPLRAEDVGTLALVARGLVETAAREWQAGSDPDPTSVSELRLANWTAALHGTTGSLIHPSTGLPVPAAIAIGALWDRIRLALQDSGDEREVFQGLVAILSRGTGAVAQRDVFRRTGSLESVVLDALGVTMDETADATSGQRAGHERARASGWVQDSHESRRAG